jgi:riboflavin synthase
MFTGIIQSMSSVVATSSKEACFVVRIKKPAGWKLSLGQSVSVDGVCSTVTLLRPSFFEVEYMPETLAKTTVRSFEKNTKMNLERSLTLHDFIDGHLVSGHVDGCGVVQKIEVKGNTKEITITIPKELKKYIATKGSVTMNGVSLTVARAEKNTFRVALIPYTLEHTNLGLLEKGSHVNVEIDVVARYVEKMIQEER